jgi:hypothetical protein
MRCLRCREGTAAVKIAGKSVLKVFLLDNSMKTLLIDDDTTAGVRFCAFLCSAAAQFVTCSLKMLVLQDVVREMAEKLGVRDVAYVSSCLSLHECADNVTSTHVYVKPISFLF